MDFLCMVLGWALVWGALGFVLGSQKGQHVSGFVWAALLGPIGLVIVALLPDIRQQKLDIYNDYGVSDPIPPMQTPRARIEAEERANIEARRRIEAEERMRLEIRARLEAEARGEKQPQSDESPITRKVLPPGT